MITQNMLADAASTPAYLWAHGCPDPDHARNRVGVERLLLAYPAAIQLALCTMVWRYLEDWHSSADAQAFTEWLCELAGVSTHEA